MEENGNNTISFQVKIGVMDIYRFLMYYNYRSFGGVLGVIISLGCLVCLGLTYQHNELGVNVLYLVLGLLFTVIQPLMLLKKASMQVVSNQAFRNPLTYEIGEEQVVIRQEKEEAPIAWEQVVRTVETKKQLLLYTSRVNACIWPKDQMDGKVEQVKALIEGKIGKEHCNWTKKEEK